MGSTRAVTAGKASNRKISSGGIMNFWEELGLTIFSAILRQLKFDPSKHTLLEKVLTPIRDELNMLYPISVSPIVNSPTGP